MEQRIVGGGDGAAQTGLFRLPTLKGGEMLRLFEEILRYSHEASRNAACSLCVRHLN